MTAIIKSALETGIKSSASVASRINKFREKQAGAKSRSRELYYQSQMESEFNIMSYFKTQYKSYIEIQSEVLRNMDNIYLNPRLQLVSGFIPANIEMSHYFQNGESNVDALSYNLEKNSTVAAYVNSFIEQHSNMDYRLKLSMYIVFGLAYPNYEDISDDTFLAKASTENSYSEFDKNLVFKGFKPEATSFMLTKDVQIKEKPAESDYQKLSDFSNEYKSAFAEMKSKFTTECMILDAIIMTELRLNATDNDTNKYLIPENCRSKMLIGYDVIKAENKIDRSKNIYCSFLYNKKA